MTNRLHLALAQLARDLAGHRQRFALVGGIAVSVRAEPRLTRDLDVAIAVEGDAQAEALIRALIADGYGSSAIVEQEHADRLAAIRLLAHGDAKGVLVDLLFASSGIEPEIVDAADSIEVFPELVVPVARVGHLVVLKLLARDDRHRPQDADDLRALRRVADAAAIELARESARLVAARGFARGRDLTAALDAWVAGPPG